MKTILAKADAASVKKAAGLLQAGEIVAIPTETVYGIAASAFNGAAVKKIFEAKGRPQDNPLIVHIDRLEMLEGLVSGVPQGARALAEAFWPGPLTIIMPRAQKWRTKSAPGWTPWPSACPATRWPGRSLPPAACLWRPLPPTAPAGPAPPSRRM